MVIRWDIKSTALSLSSGILEHKETRYHLENNKKLADILSRMYHIYLFVSVSFSFLGAMRWGVISRCHRSENNGVSWPGTESSKTVSQNRLFLLQVDLFWCSVITMESLEHSIPPRLALPSGSSHWHRKHGLAVSCIQCDLTYPFYICLVTLTQSHW